MIPSIEDILAMLLAGECTKEQASAWINRHVEMASEGDGLRDHFAGLACNACISGCISAGISWSLGDIAKEAYQVADAMLKARYA